MFPLRYCRLHCVGGIPKARTLSCEKYGAPQHVCLYLYISISGDLVYGRDPVYKPIDTWTPANPNPTFVPFSP